MRLRSLVLAAALALVAVPALAQPERFDLVCDVRNVSTGEPGPVEHLRVDLGAMTWCDNNYHKCSKGAASIRPVGGSLMLSVERENLGGGAVGVYERWLDADAARMHVESREAGVKTWDAEGPCRHLAYSSPDR